MNYYSIAPFIKEFYPEYWGECSYDADKCIRIHKVDDQWGIFCNFAATPLSVNGFTFKSSEQLFQLMKFKDREIVGNILAGITNNGKNCHEVKRTAKSYEKEFRREDWGSMIVDAMKFCLQTKYDQCEDFRRKLEESEGYFIVEDQTSFPKKSPDAWGVKLYDGQFIGPNLLGRLLMELRDNKKLSFVLPNDALTFIEGCC